MDERTGWFSGGCTGFGALCAGESGGNGENGASGLSGIGSIPGLTMGELAGSGEHRGAGAKPVNMLPVRINVSCAPMIRSGPSSSLSSNSIEIGIFMRLPSITGGFAEDAVNDGSALATLSVVTGLLAVKYGLGSACGMTGGRPLVGSGFSRMVDGAGSGLASVGNDGGSDDDGCGDGDGMRPVVTLWKGDAVLFIAALMGALIDCG